MDPNSQYQPPAAPNAATPFSNSPQQGQFAGPQVQTMPTYPTPPTYATAPAAAPQQQAAPAPNPAQPAPPQPVVAAAEPQSLKAGAPPKKADANSTQNMLQVAEIRDGIVIMNDGSFRTVIMVKSINFDLMSRQEQEAVEFSYQAFLNSLFFPIQIFVRSQKVDLDPYLEKLDKIRGEHDNMLLALLMEDYISYMAALAEQTNIMDKKFYVVVPYMPNVETQKPLTQSKNFVSGLTALFGGSNQHVVINEAELEKAKTELRNRVQQILSGLLRCGIQGLPLDTQELIELYYDTYNPDTATRQQLKDFNTLTSDIVVKGAGTAPQPHLERELG